MKRRFISVVLAASMFFSLTACNNTNNSEEVSVSSSEGSGTSSVEFESKDDGARIAVFQTSDIHGYIADIKSTDESTFEYRLAYIAQIINNARTSGEYDDVLLLDGGDIYQGAPISNMTDGAVMRAAFDIMDYDAVALGNHEFDWGVDVYSADADGTLPAYAVGSYKGDPDIPVVASNLYYADTGERTAFTKDYVIVEKAGYRICVVGYIQDYSLTIMSSQIAPYVIKPELDVFAKRVHEINELENPDVTIVLAHDTPEHIADAFTTDEVQLVAGGHVHAGLAGVASSGVPYIQGNSQAQSYSSAVIVIDSAGNVTIENPECTYITEEPELLYDTPENAELLDDEILALTKEVWKEVKVGLGEVLGYIDTDILKKGFIDDVTTTGGNFITWLMIETMKDDGAIIAFFNAKGFRCDLAVPEGGTREITVGDVYAFSPFNNYWLMFDLSGAELVKHIENGLYNGDYGDQVTGLTYEYYKTGTEDDPVYEVVSITLADGTPVDINGTDPVYRVVTSNYNATLEGSVFEGKDPVVPEVDAPIDNIAIIELLRDRRDAEGSDGYIPVDVTPRGTCLNASENEEAA